MKFLLKFVCRELFYHRTRTLLALLAILTTSCMVVWFVGNLNMAGMQKKSQVKEFFGQYTLILFSSEPLDGTFQETLKGCSEVERLDWAFLASSHMARADRENALADKMRQQLGTPMRSPNLLGLGTAVAPFEMEEGRWYSAPMECVLSTAAISLLKGWNDTSDSAMQVGDELAIDTPEGEKRLKVVGIFEQNSISGGRMGGSMGTFAFGFGVGLGGGPPSSSGQKAPSANTQQPPPRRSDPGAASVYVSLEDAYRITGKTPEVNMAYVTLNRKVAPADFYALLEKKLGKSLSEMQVATADIPAMEKRLEEQLSGDSLWKQVWSTLGLVLLASVFIIFTTLSMGVSERVRLLAMLRTLGLTRFQIAASIMLEGLLLGILGWLGGMVSGWLLLLLLNGFQTGRWLWWMPTWNVWLLSLGCSLCGALLASIIPAWRATRIAPLESMVRRSRNLTPGQILVAGIVGLVLLSLVPMFVFWFDWDKGFRLAMFSTFGTLFLMGGFLLLFPGLMVLTEKVLGPAVARILGFDSHFLANQLTSHQWRTMGTTMAVSIGLGLFTAVQIWSASMVAIFTIPDTIPDTLVAFLPNGVSSQDARAVRKLPWVVEEDFMRMVVEQPSLDLESMPQWQEMGGIGMDNVTIFGLDPQIAFRAENPTVRLKVLEGSREEILRGLCSPDVKGCVISDAFSLRAGLHVGDKLRLIAPESARRGRGGPGGRPGGGMRGEGNRPAPDNVSQVSQTPSENPPAPAPPKDVPPKDAPPEGIRPGGMRPGGGSAETAVVEYTVVGVVELPGWQWLTKRSGVRTQAGRTGALLFAAYDDVKFDFHPNENAFFWFNTKPGTKYEDVFDTMQEIAKRSLEKPEPTGENVGLGEKPYPGDAFQAASARGLRQKIAQVSTVESLNESLFGRAGSVIAMMSRMPLMILILSTIAVLNTMVISVRSRWWEMGVLRAYGVTRSGLIRMILAESILIGLCACVLSFSFGWFYSWLANGMVQYTSFFGEVPPPVVVPWNQLGTGYFLALAVCLLASLWPAFTAGLREPSQLLQRKE